MSGDPDSRPHNLQVEPTDPLTFVLITLIEGATVVFASYIAARRALRVDPMVSFRCEQQRRNSPNRLNPAGAISAVHESGTRLTDRLWTSVRTYS